MNIVVEWNGKEIKLGKAVQNKQRTTLNIISANGKINLLIDARNCNKGNQKSIRKIYGDIEKAVRHIAENDKKVTDSLKKFKVEVSAPRIKLDEIVEKHKVAGLETRFLAEGRNIINNKEELTVILIDKNNLYNMGEFKGTSDNTTKENGVNGKIKGLLKGEQLSVKVDIGLASDFIAHLTENVKQETGIVVIDLEKEKIGYDMATGVKVTTTYEVV